MENKICNFLIELTRLEEQVEDVREELGARPDFDMITAFTGLDLNKKGYLTADDILGMVSSRGFGGLGDINKWMALYFPYSPGRITYKEFERIFSPVDD